MATQQKSRSAKPSLVLKIHGPEIKSGRIPVPDLVVICEQAQSAVNRQAEALEGRQTLRPGPPLERVRDDAGDGRRRPDRHRLRREPA